MKFIIDNAINIFLGFLVLIVIFHFCIILKFIPYDIAWGGRLQSDEQMYVFESVSILINIFLSWILLMKGDVVKFKFSSRAINITLWVFLVLFLLNTVGNIFAKTTVEKFFAILTGLFAFLLWCILKQKKNLPQAIS